MAEPVIRIDRLTKRYGKRRGIEDVTFDVRPGEVFGFLGPNGAGKTTTMRVLLDLLRPTSGRATVFGKDPRQDAPGIHARTGYLAGETGLVERMSAADQLRYLANLRGGVPQERIDALARRFDLDVKRELRQMSRGNKQKVGIVQAFMHEPELLVLDEPTGGLDPLMQQEFHALIQETKARGATVLLSSHMLNEVEALCDRVAIIREGRLVAVDDTDALKERAVRRARIRFARPPDARALEGVAGVSDVHVDDAHLTCAVTGPTGPLVKALASMDVVDLSLKERSLEDVFLGYYAKEARG